jgi:hypothetical protein
MDRRWNKNHSVMLISILAFAILLYGGLYIIVIQPLKTEEDQLQTEVDMYETTYDRIGKSTKKGTLEELEQLSLKIPNEKAPSTILNTISTLAEVHEITVTNFEAIDPTIGQTEDVGLNIASYRVLFHGKSLASVHDFLNEILGSERFFTIDSINITQNESNVDAEISLSAYYTE